MNTWRKHIAEWTIGDTLYLSVPFTWLLDEASLRPPAPDNSDAWEWIATNDPDALPAVEPCVRRVADGIPERLEPAVRRHRLRCLGNAVVPAQAAMAVSDLLERLTGSHDSAVAGRLGGAAASDGDAN